MSTHPTSPGGLVSLAPQAPPTLPATLFGAVLIGVFAFALPAAAASGNITLPFQIIEDAPGSTHILYDGPMPVVGEECELTASDAGNNTSVHPGNNLALVTGGETVTFSDVERAPNVSTPGSGTVTPADTGTVTLTLGPDGVYSADLILEFTCQHTTTTSTTVPSSTSSTVPPSTSTTAPPTSSTTTTTVPTSTVPAPTTTAPTEPCIEDPSTPELECLPFTGPTDGPWLPLAGGLVLAGLATFGYARRMN